MKELCGLARNLFLVVDEPTGALVPCCELVLQLCEPKYSRDGLGQPHRKSKLETVRVIAQQAVLKSLGRSLLEWAKELDPLLKPPTRETTPEKPCPEK